MKAKKIIFPVIIIGCMSALATWHTFASGTKERNEVLVQPDLKPVPIVVVSKSANQSIRSFPGYVRANSRVDLAFSIDGLLTHLNAIEGQKVLKGDIIARLDHRDVQNTYEVSKAQYDMSKKDFNRAKQLLEQKIIPQAEFDRSKKSYDVAAAEMRIRKKAVDDTALIAPFNGIVSKRYVENFQRIKAKDNIISMKDISKVEVVIQIPERIIAYGGKNNFERVDVNFDAVPEKWYGAKIKEFSIEPDPITRTYDVVVSLDPPDDIVILPGMTATVKARTDNPDALAAVGPNIQLPLAAVAGENESTSYVWVIPASGGNPEKRIVRIGEIRRDGIEIINGLSTGELVAVAGVHSLTEEMFVRPAKKNREGLDQ